MELSIVILHSNTPKDVEMCLRSMRQARLPRETEIIVINNRINGANDLVPADAWEGLDVRFLETDVDGYIYGNNLGYKLATGRIIGTMNADITMEADTIERLVAHLDAHPETGIVAPRLFYPSGQEQDSARPFPSAMELIKRRVIRNQSAKRPQFGSNEWVEIDWVTGAFFFMTRTCLNAVGGHDERFHLFMSDVAICRNTWAVGLHVRQLRDCRATHHEARLSGGNLWKLIHKRTGRIHVKDSLKYFLHYGRRPLPPLSPSAQR